MWRVLRNNKDLGIIETNWLWASNYWFNKSTKEIRYKLEAI